MSIWNTPAATRVASLREQAEYHGDPTAGLSDLELLNTAYESVLREQIDTRDHLMGLLTSLRKHDDQVRAAAVAAFKGHADRYAQDRVREHMRPFDELLYRAQKLPDRPDSAQVDGLRSAAVRVAFQLKEAGPATELIDPDGARHTLRTLGSVIGVLDGREGLDGADVLRLVKAALDGGPLTDLFDIADCGTRPPDPAVPTPPFAGPGWSEEHSFWLFQPDNSDAHVKAFQLGQHWQLELWSGRGPLLAFGRVPGDEVAALAPVLTARAGAWASVRGEYAWRRFADTAEAVRTGGVPAPDSTRARAAAATSPAHARAGDAATPLTLAITDPVRAPSVARLGR
ncbi:hypothetical protein ACFVUH_08420 [Kitasatospora sp. NPDC058032]|uniref:hypothetical protein n=1 Tax=Kitasatospora sp. NPDC058032 TaxID=3346307 RepID=UPI0036DFA03A